jgi:hypothetical protein
MLVLAFVSQFLKVHLLLMDQVRHVMLLVIMFVDFAVMCGSLSRFYLATAPACLAASS